MNLYFMFPIFFIELFGIYFTTDDNITRIRSPLLPEIVNIKPVGVSSFIFIYHH